MGGIVRTIKKVVKSVVKAVTKVIGAIMQPFGFSPDVPDFGLDEGLDQESLIQGVLLNKDSAIANIPVVYGTRMIGGVRVFVSTNGTNNKYLYVAQVLAEGQINALSSLLIDDNVVPLSSYAHGVQATPSSGDYASKLTVQFFDGRDDQVASTLFTGNSVPGWTSDHRLRGVAYLAFRFEWAKDNTQASADNNPYRGGIPNIKAIVQGKNIYDATTLTADSTTYHDTAYADEPTTFTNNPVSDLLDYMRNPRYGKGLPNNVFNFDTWKTAADLCDQVVAFTGSTTGKAFTCDAVVNTSLSLMSNIKIILSGFRGIMPYTQGKYKLMIEHAGDDTDIDSTSTPSTVMTVTNDHIVGGMQLEGESKTNKVNRVIVTYVDPDSDYQPNQAVYPVEGSSTDNTYMTEDNQIRLEKTVTLPTVANREQALQFAEVFTKRSRTGKTISFNTTIATSNLTVGDLITVVNAHISLNGIFRISDIRIDVDGSVSIGAVEHQPATYAIIAKPDDITRPSINLPNPNQVIAPTSLVLASGSAQNLQGTETTGYFVDTSVSVIRRLKASWTATTDVFVDDYIVQFKKTSDSDYATAVVTADVSTFIFPVGLGQSYDVRVCARNELNRRSDFLTVTGHTIVA